MNFYNTLSETIEPFEPSGGGVTLYVCGITPYDTTHLGHAFTYTVADLLVRHLESQGLAVRYVQNVTDIDDDILRKAAETGEDWRALGNRWTAHFIRDMQVLNVRPPDAYPRATDVIPETSPPWASCRAASRVRLRRQRVPSRRRLGRLRPAQPSAALRDAGRGQ
jgi:L-cysteine:1D-myo-inositol 2-amino-2-deoxy-alpha-D-glucopyranoside ligase